MASPYEVGMLWFVSLAVAVAAFGAYAGAAAAAGVAFAVAFLLGVAGAAGWLKDRHGRRRTARRRPRRAASSRRAGVRGAREDDGVVAQRAERFGHFKVNAPPPCVVASCLLIPLVVAVVGWPLWTIAVIFLAMLGIAGGILWAVFGDDWSEENPAGASPERDRGDG